MILEAGRLKSQYGQGLSVLRVWEKDLSQASLSLYMSAIFLCLFISSSLYVYLSSCPNSLPLFTMVVLPRAAQHMHYQHQNFKTFWWYMGGIALEWKEVICTCLYLEGLSTSEILQKQYTTAPFCKHFENICVYLFCLFKLKIREEILV